MYSAFDFFSFVLLYSCSSVSIQRATGCMNTVVYSETDEGHIKIVLLILSRKLNQHGMSLLR